MRAVSALLARGAGRVTMGPIGATIVSPLSPHRGAPIAPIGVTITSPLRHRCGTAAPIGARRPTQHEALRQICSAAKIAVPILVRGSAAFQERNLSVDLAPFEPAASDTAVAAAKRAVQMVMPCAAVEELRCAPGEGKLEVALDELTAELTAQQLVDAVGTYVIEVSDAEVHAKMTVEEMVAELRGPLQRQQSQIHDLQQQTAMTVESAVSTSMRQLEDDILDLYDDEQADSDVHFRELPRGDVKKFDNLIRGPFYKWLQRRHKELCDRCGKRVALPTQAEVFYYLGRDCKTGAGGRQVLNRAVHQQDPKKLAGRLMYMEAGSDRDLCKLLLLLLLDQELLDKPAK